MSKTASKLIVVRTGTGNPNKFVPMFQDYKSQWNHGPAQTFDNLKDARKAANDMAAQEKWGRTWLVMRVEVEIPGAQTNAPVMANGDDETDIG